MTEKRGYTAQAVVDVKETFAAARREMAEMITGAIQSVGTSGTKNVVVSAAPRVTVSPTSTVSGGPR